MSNYKSIIRHVQAVANGRPAPKQEVNYNLLGSSSSAWDKAPQYDVDQYEVPQEGFWVVEDMVDFDEDPCQFF